MTTSMTKHRSLRRQRPWQNDFDKIIHDDKRKLRQGYCVTKVYDERKIQRQKVLVKNVSGKKIREENNPDEWWRMPDTYVSDEPLATKVKNKCPSYVVWNTSAPNTLEGQSWQTKSLYSAYVTMYSATEIPHKKSSLKSTSITKCLRRIARNTENIVKNNARNSDESVHEKSAFFSDETSMSNCQANKQGNMTDNSRPTLFLEIISFKLTI